MARFSRAYINLPLWIRGATLASISSSTGSYLVSGTDTILNYNRILGRSYTLTIVSPHTVESASINSASTAGGTTMGVTGSGFNKSLLPNVVFGSTTSSTTFLSTTQLNSVVPAHASGSVVVSINQAGYIVNLPIQFEFIAVTSSASVPLYSDGFELYADGTALTAHGDGSFQWHNPSTDVRVSTSLARTGTKSLRFIFPSSSEYSNREQWFHIAATTESSPREMWIEWYQHIPSNWIMNEVGTAYNNKHLIVWCEDYQGLASSSGVELNTGRISPTSSYLRIGSAVADGFETRSSAQCSTIRGIVIDDSMRDSWVRYRYHIKAAVTSSIIDVWRDNAKIAEVVENFSATRPEWSGSADYFRHGYLLGTANTGYPEEMTFHIDDFALYNEDPGWTGMENPFYATTFGLGTWYNEKGFSWTDPTNVTISQELEHWRGIYCLRFAHAATADNVYSRAEQRFLLGRELSEIWMEWMMYYPNGTEGISAAYTHRHNTTASSNNKFFRLWGGSDYDATNKIGASTLPIAPAGSSSGSTLIQEGMPNEQAIGQIGPEVNFINEAVHLGRWILVRIHAKFATSATANNGIFQFWWDNQLIIDNQAVDTWSTTAPNYWDRGYILGEANSGYASATRIYICAVKFYDTNPQW